MKKYAKIINDETKLCEVGTGTNFVFYRGIGMTEMEVELAYDGKWYVEGYAPTKPDADIKADRIAELEAYLYSTDWYAIRESETGVDIPADVKQARADARAEISSLQGDEEPLAEPEPVVDTVNATEEPVVELYSMEI